jgi:hypothetical protein
VVGAILGESFGFTWVTCRALRDGAGLHGSPGRHAPVPTKGQGWCRSDPGRARRHTKTSERLEALCLGAKRASTRRTGHRHKTNDDGSPRAAPSPRSSCDDGPVPRQSARARHYLWTHLPNAFKFSGLYRKDPESGLPSQPTGPRREGASGPFPSVLGAGHEAGHSSRLQSGDGRMRLWSHVRDQRHCGKRPPRYLLGVPSVLHRQAAPRRHSRSSRPVQEEVRRGRQEVRRWAGFAARPIVHGVFRLRPL